MGLPSTGVRQLLTDDNRNMWVVTDKIIVKYDFSDHKRTSIVLNKPIIAANTIGSNIAVIWKDNSIGIYDSVKL